MHEIGMQEQVGDQLIQMEIIGQEEVKAADIGQVDSSQLEYKCCKECNQVDDKQILCNRGYAEHHIIYYLTIFYFVFSRFVP